MVLQEPVSLALHLAPIRITHPVNSEVPEHTASGTRCHTAVLNLCRPGVGVHLRQLELGLGTGTSGQGGVADHVAERLAIIPDNVRSGSCQLNSQMGAFLESAGISPGQNFLPFGLGLLEGHALVVVTDQAGVDEPREVQLLRVE